MKGVVLVLGAVAVLGWAGQSSSRSVVESPQDTVFDELAAVLEIRRSLPRVSKRTGLFSTVWRSSGLSPG